MKYRLIGEEKTNKATIKKETERRKKESDIERVEQSIFRKKTSKKEIAK